jgi:hypothetical protein
MLQAFRTEGSLIANGSLDLGSNEHISQFVSQFIPQWAWSGGGGVLDINATSPFVALTIRSLRNSRNDFLFTLFPIADLTRPAPSPIIFPQIADGEGYQTEFILLGAGAGGNSALSFFDNTGSPMAIGQRP